ncbi:hypothetical protein B0H17DRAFT_1207871 [Mycena rosella]|uniref:Uncharacterized protein n=1 Tax=Mycena rosella TaxID=1033263 RepID=A0AAD7D218_MYCRO|nr:hypothetical protein B0H17DRAFT_1207871 [Mycena rosella]
MNSAPQDVADCVWSRVLFFAMVADRQHIAALLEARDDEPDKRRNSARLLYLFVSKTFCRLALPYLYGYPAFAPEYQASHFVSRLERHAVALCALARRSGGKSVFALCPNITQLTLQIDARPVLAAADHLEFPSRDLRFPAKHTLVKLLVVNKYENPYKTKELEDWGLLFKTLDFANFPALCELRISACEWPTMEHTIWKSPWVKHSEALASSAGMQGALSRFEKCCLLQPFSPRVR